MLVIQPEAFYNNSLMLACLPMLRYMQESAKFYFQHKARFKNEILSGLTVAIAQVGAANSRGVQCVTRESVISCLSIMMHLLSISL